MFSTVFSVFGNAIKHRLFVVFLQAPFPYFLDLSSDKIYLRRRGSKCRLKDWSKLGCKPRIEAILFSPQCSPTIVTTKSVFTFSFISSGTLTFGTPKGNENWFEKLAQLEKTGLKFKCLLRQGK